MQSQKENLKSLRYLINFLLKENMKSAPDISHFFLTLLIIIGHIIEGNTISPLKLRIDAILKLQTPSKFVNKRQIYLRPFDKTLRQKKSSLNGY